MGEGVSNVSVMWGVAMFASLYPNVQILCCLCLNGQIVDSVEKPIYYIRVYVQGSTKNRRK